MTNISDQKRNSDLANAKAARATLAKDIRGKWDKFSEIEVGAMKTESDLVTQLVAKYGFEKPEAETEAKTLVAGRQF